MTLSSQSCIGFNFSYVHRYYVRCVLVNVYLYPVKKRTQNPLMLLDFTVIVLFPAATSTEGPSLRTPSWRPRDDWSSSSRCRARDCQLCPYRLFTEVQPHLYTCMSYLMWTRVPCSHGLYVVRCSVLDLGLWRYLWWHGSWGMHGCLSCVLVFLTSRDEGTSLLYFEPGEIDMYFINVSSLCTLKEPAVLPCSGQIAKFLRLSVAPDQFSQGLSTLPLPGIQRKIYTVSAQTTAYKKLLPLLISPYTECKKH